MTTIVDNKSLVEFVTTGSSPIPPEVASDNEKTGVVSKQKLAPLAQQDPATDTVAGKVDAVDDGENPDGLTAEEKSTLTEKMKRAVAKRHSRMKEAEEFAAEQYNTRRLAEQRAEQLERELNRMRAQIKGGEQAEQPAQEQNTRPKREAFKTEEDYHDAVVDWRVEQRIQEDRRKAETEREQQEQQTRKQIVGQRLDSAREVVPDFDQIVGAADHHVPEHVGSYMLDSQKVAELGYHFAKHPEDLERISAMPARTAADIMKVGLAISKIEDTLRPFASSATHGEQPSTQHGNAATRSLKPSTETGSSPSKPRAPEPIQPLNGTSGPLSNGDEREMNAREVISAWARSRKSNITERKRH